MRLNSIIQENKRYFHGSHSFYTDGLKAGKSAANYMGSLKQALAYGSVVYEIEVSSGDALVDEDAILMMANPDDPSWVDQIINLPQNKKDEFHRVVMQEGGWEAGYSDLQIIDYINTYGLKVEADSDGSLGNIKYDEAIGFDGDVKIVAVYKLDKLDTNGYGTSQYRVSKVLYGADPTLKVGNVVTGSNEKLC